MLQLGCPLMTPVYWLSRTQYKHSPFNWIQRISLLLLQEREPSGCRGGQVGAGGKRSIHSTPSSTLLKNRHWLKKIIFREECNFETIFSHKKSVNEFLLFSNKYLQIFLAVQAQGKIPGRSLINYLCIYSVYCIYLNSAQLLQGSHQMLSVVLYIYSKKTSVNKYEPILQDEVILKSVL